jgi:hypothetical protein
VSLDRIVHIPLVPRVSGINEQSQVMTLEQTAEYVRISKAQLSRVIAGRVPGVPTLRHARIGRRILIKRSWAEEWLDRAGQESSLANARI